MLRIIRNFYQAGYLSGTDAVAAAISGGTLINGDQLYYNTTSQRYATVVGNAIQLATN